MTKLATFILPALLLAVPPQTPDAPRGRRLVQYVQSDALPLASIGVDASLPFIGRVEFDVRGRARAEQFFFSEVRNGRLGRTAIVHFEYFLPDNDATFGYPDFRLVQLAGQAFLHQTWPTADYGIFRQAEVKAMLDAHGLTAEADWITNRYARVMDDPKHELLLFYLEPASGFSTPMADMTAEAHPSGVPQQPGAWMDIANAVAERASRVFELRPGVR